MKVLVTGSGGLVGYHTALSFLNLGAKVIGIDNNNRQQFFGPSADVSPLYNSLKMHQNYIHYDCDISDQYVHAIFKSIKPDVVVHCAAQPSHDKAAAIPYDDFNTNAFGTFNLLECFRQHCNQDAVFIFMSTNKVYGDRPNFIPLEEGVYRYDFTHDSGYADGIDESMSVDHTTHSLFGASKLSADIYSQEYGRYFDRNVVVFRGGCLTGRHHRSVPLHGFLSYIVNCCVTGQQYVVNGYKGKQVRDQIHVDDIFSAINEVVHSSSKKYGVVYNLGGGLENSASILEVIQYLEDRHGKQLNYTVSNVARKGDHICYYTNMKKFKDAHPSWQIKRNIFDIIDEMVHTYGERK